MKRVVVATVICLLHTGFMYASVSQKETKRAQSLLVQGHKLSEYVAYQELRNIGKSEKEIEALAKLGEKDLYDKVSGKFSLVNLSNFYGEKMYTVASKQVGMLCVQKVKGVYFAYRHVPLVNASGAFQGMSQGLPLCDPCLCYRLLQALHTKQSKK